MEFLETRRIFNVFSLFNTMFENKTLKFYFPVSSCSLTKKIDIYYFFITFHENITQQRVL